VILPIKSGESQRPSSSLFDGNMAVRAREIVNNPGLAGNLQSYGISSSGSTTTQTVSISPLGDFAATVYPPSADLAIKGNPDIVGAVVAKSFYANGNVSCTMIALWT
jgi:hypothetical protein